MELPSTEALDRAAFALFKAAGRPEGLWQELSAHEKAGWRHMVLVVLKAVTEQ